MSKRTPEEDAVRSLMKEAVRGASPRKTTATDILDRMRERQADLTGCVFDADAKIFGEGADEIERLRALVPEQEGASEALGEPKASEHLSSERRRGLEEALRILEEARQGYENLMHSSDNFARGNNSLKECALHDAIKDIRALIPPSSEGGEEKTDPIREELAAALEAMVEGVMHADPQTLLATPWMSRMTQNKLDAARAALSKHRDDDHPPAVASGGSRR